MSNKYIDNFGNKYRREQKALEDAALKMPQPSELCYELLKHYEGCHLDAYQDIAGIWTIGYGATYYPDGRRVKQGDKITQDEADSMLPEMMRTFAISVWQAIKVPLLQHEYDALCCFAYNVGIGNLERSTLIQVINRERPIEYITEQFMRWNKARVNGELKPVKGLTYRRQSEAYLYEHGVNKFLN